MFSLCRPYVCDSGLKGRFPVAQGAALGLVHPQKLILRPEGPISKRECILDYARGLVLTHLALLKPALQAWRGLWGVVTRCLRTWLY